MKFDTCFARQPIFDAAERLTAYEVLYRSATSLEAVIDDPIEATRAVLADAFGDIENVDRLDGLLGYVNMPREILFDGTLRGYSPTRLGIEVLEDIQPDGHLIEILEAIRGAGYSVALDDFRLGEGREALLMHADIVKVDVLAHDQDQLHEIARALLPTGLVMLAEKVETREQLARCRQLGFEMFQGFFFARPELMAGSDADRNRGIVQSLADIHRHTDDPRGLVAAMERHTDLTNMMLAILNSRMIGFPSRISSIGAAVAMLGSRRIVELATAILLVGSETVPGEVATLALMRARMCAIIANASDDPDPMLFFSAGTMSVLDALTDMPICEIIEDVPLTTNVAEAVVDRTGRAGQALAATVAYERADWDLVTRHALDLDLLADAYIDALDWSTRMAVVVRSFT